MTYRGALACRCVQVAQALWTIPAPSTLNAIMGSLPFVLLDWNQ